MLSLLKVKNFAIIDNLTVEFTDGFTALTGETGAGKSLIIDAIGLLFGDRSSTMMIRSGEAKALVEGIFENVSDNTKNILNELQIELLDGDTVAIKREISNQGKSLIRVNGEIITLNQLDLIASTLGDIHTQTDTHKLFKPQNYLTFIDNEEVASLSLIYNEARKKYLKAIKNYNEINELSILDTTNFEFWQYQYNELEKANLNINEEKNLEEELDYLNNFEYIHKNLLSINELFNDNNILDHLYEIISYTDKLAKIKSDYQKDSEKLNDCYYELEDLSNKFKNSFKSLDFDNVRLDEINERLSYLNSLKNKYKKNIKELIQFKGELKAKIESFEQIDDKILDAKKEVENSFSDLLTKTIDLTNARKKSAKKLEESVLNTLNDLMLSKVKLNISFDEYNVTDPYNSSIFKTNGADNIDILISFNIGEPLRPLSKIASGGEMSRIMLALKVHVLKTLKLSTVIFDEIDSGVSGSVAGKIAEKLKEISKDTQLLAITHLPIVASYSDQHYNIYKEFTENSTSTKIKELSVDERISVLSEMINPNDTTNQAYELAKTMLENNK